MPFSTSSFTATARDNTTWPEQILWTDPLSIGTIPPLAILLPCCPSVDHTHTQLSQRCELECTRPIQSHYDSSSGPAACACVCDVSSRRTRPRTSTGGRCHQGCSQCWQPQLRFSLANGRQKKLNHKSKKRAFYLFYLQPFSLCVWIAHVIDLNTRLA
jgi:hypothetical protein